MARSTPKRRPERDDDAGKPDLIDLVGKARDGDEPAFEALFALCSGRILNFIHASSGRDEDVSRDLLQETFLKVHSKLRGLRDQARFESWLYAIASNCCRDHLRKKRLEPVSDTNLVERTADRKIQAGRDGKIGDSETMEAVRRTVLKMPEKLRQVFLLKKMEERTYDEIAELLGCSVRTAKYRMERSWDLLLKELNRKGIRIPERAGD